MACRAVAGRRVAIADKVTPFISMHWVTRSVPISPEPITPIRTDLDTIAPTIELRGDGLTTSPTVRYSGPVGIRTATASVEPPPLVEPRPERRHPDVPAPSAAPAAVTIKSEPAMVRAVDPADLGSPSAAPANAGAGDALSMGAPSVPELAVEEPGDKDAEAALALLGDEGGQP